MIHFVYVVSETIDGNDCFRAAELEIQDTANLVGYFKAIPNIFIANIYPTRKKAVAVADFWNDSFKKNGTFLEEV